jgi:phosphatidylglycerophosphate synthase
MPSVVESLRALNTAQKTSVGVSLYSRYVNRPIGRVLAALAFAAGLTPNVVTGASAISSGAGIALLATVEPSFALGLLVTALLVLGFALDSADGQVARLRGGGSPAGEWLDHVIDAGKMTALHAAVLVGLARWGAVGEPWLLVPLGFQLVAVVVFAAGTLALVLKKGNSTSAARRPSLVRAVGLLPADYGVLALSFLLWGWTEGFFAVYVVLFVLNFLIGGALVTKQFRELRRL